MQRYRRRFQDHSVRQRHHKSYVSTLLDHSVDVDAEGLHRAKFVEAGGLKLATKLPESLVDIVVGTLRVLKVVIAESHGFRAGANSDGPGGPSLPTDPYRDLWSLV